MATSSLDASPGVQSRDARASTVAGARRPVPKEMLGRVSGALNQLLACGIVQQAADGLLELSVNAEEVAQGGMVTISMYVPVGCAACEGRADAPCARCEGRGTTDALFSAWLTVYPGASDGELLTPSVPLPGMLQPVTFRLCVPAPT